MFLIKIHGDTLPRPDLQRIFNSKTQAQTQQIPLVFLNGTLIIPSRFFRGKRKIIEYKRKLDYKKSTIHSPLSDRRRRETVDRKGKTYGQREDNKALYFHSNPQWSRYEPGDSAVGVGGSISKITSLHRVPISCTPFSIPLCSAATFRHASI